MSETIVIADRNPEYHGPLTLTRPLYDLKCGTMTLADRLIQKYPGANIVFMTREYLALVYRQSLVARGINAKVNDLSEVVGNGALFLDGAILALSEDNLPEIGGNQEGGIVDEVINYDKNGKVSERRERITYVRLKSERLQALYSQSENPEDLIDKIFSSEETKKVEHEGVRVMTYPWHLIMANGDAIRADYEEMKREEPNPGWISKGVVVYNPRERKEYRGNRIITAIEQGEIPVILSEGVVLEPGVKINYGEGPVIFGEGVRVRPPTIIDGPFFADEKTLIDGAKIRGGCSIGPVCKIAGELEASIIHAYSNKHHGGFMGHAYIGEWCNWGAGTKNSDLKNDYGNVEVILGITGIKGKIFKKITINSGEYKEVGMFMGDHTKAALDSAFNTGTVVGIMSNVISNGNISSKYITSFCLYKNGKIFKNAVERAIVTGQKVMQRRDVEMTEEYKSMLRFIRDMAEAERKVLIKQSRR